MENGIDSFPAFRSWGHDVNDFGACNSVCACDDGGSVFLAVRGREGGEAIEGAAL